jgi:hypothetical protein
MLQAPIVSVERDGVCRLVVQVLHTNAVLRLTAPSDANQTQANRVFQGVGVHTPRNHGGSACGGDTRDSAAASATQKNILVRVR